MNLKIGCRISRGANYSNLKCATKRRKTLQALTLHFNILKVKTKIELPNLMSPKLLHLQQFYNGARNHTQICNEWNGISGYTAGDSAAN